MEEDGGRGIDPILEELGSDKKGCSKGWGPHISLVTDQVGNGAHGGIYAILNTWVSVFAPQMRTTRPRDQSSDVPPLPRQRSNPWGPVSQRKTSKLDERLCGFLLTMMGRSG